MRECSGGREGRRYIHEFGSHPGRVNHDMARNVGISLVMMLLCDSFIQLWLNDLLQRTALANEIVQIGAERAVNEVAICLFDLVLAEIFSYLDIALFPPFGPRLFKTGV